jgi:hypothetical protein
MKKVHFTYAMYGVTLLAVTACGSSQSSGGGSDNGATTPNGGSGAQTSSAGAIGQGVGGNPITSGGGAPGAAGFVGGSAGASTGSGGAAGANTAGMSGIAGSNAGGTSGTTGAAGGGNAGGAAGSAAHGGASGAAGSTGSAGASGGNNGPCDIWIAPNGSDTNPGTLAAPVLTPQHAYDLVCPGVGGSVNGDVCSGTLSTMCLEVGTYNLSTRIEFKKTRMGTSSRIITLMADPAATTKPILNFAGQPRLACGADPADKNIYGIDMGADWYRVKGIEVSSSNDSGILVQGAHDFVENCAVHDAEDTGVLVNSSSGYTGSGTYATITNVDSYHNHDERCDGANADGFGVKKGTGVGNVLDGCRAWDNSDDGYDLFAWTSPVTIKNSWAFNQGATTAGTQSNGNGFKLGGDSVSAKHIVSSLFAFANNGDGGHKADWGFTNNSNPASMTCTGCGAWDNEGGSFQGIAHTGDVNASSVTAAKAAAAKRNADGSLPAITSL